MNIEESLDLIQASPALREELLERMSEPHRFYHDLRHISDILSRYDGDDPTIVAAAWFHDIVYDPQSNKNEEQSALLALERLKDSRVVSASMVANIILDTKTHQPTTKVSKLFSDLDMSILAADPEDYARYTEGLEKEYSFLGIDAYLVGRSNFLKKLDETVIFYTEQFSSLEEKAHLNIREEIHLLATRILFRELKPQETEK